MESAFLEILKHEGGMFMMCFRKKNRNIIDGTTWEFARPGFWILHALGAAALLYLGAKMMRKRY